MPGSNLLLDTSLFFLLGFFFDCRYRFYLKLGKKLHVATPKVLSEINLQTQSFDAYRNSFLRVISVIIEIINYPFKLGKMRFNRPFFLFPDPPSILPH